MMDVVGTAASLVTLVQIVGNLTKQGRNILNRYQNAPAQLLRVANLVDLLHSELTIICHLQEDISHTGSPFLPDDITSLSQVLAIVTASFNTIHKHLENQCTSSGKRARLRWALWDHTKADGLEIRLQQDENRLNTVLQLISIRLLHLSLCETTSIKNSQQVILQNMSGLPQALSEASSNQEIDAEKSESVFQNNKSNSLDWWSWARSTDPEASNSWLKAAILAYGNKLQTNYWISLRTPLPQMDRRRAIFFNLKLRSYSLRPIGLSLPFANLSIRNIVPETSPLMIACKEGNTSKVISLFDRRKGSLDDTTPKNMTPLSSAIESGSFKLVQYLLMAGAQADTPLGIYQTSPLQYAFSLRQIHIARLLLAHGANYTHINLKGWSPLFNLYDSSAATSASAEYLSMIVGDYSSSINIQDAEGWTSLHRAAAFGFGGDIETLLLFGADVSLTTDSMEWTPLFVAVQLGNCETAAVLLKHAYSGTRIGMLEQRDKRGWTMLHLAANNGDDEMMMLLLTAGADPFALTAAESQCVASGLESRILSVAQIARNKGEAAVIAFVKALKASGWDVDVLGGRESEDEIFWLAET